MKKLFLVFLISTAHTSSVIASGNFSLPKTDSVTFGGIGGGGGGTGTNDDDDDIMAFGGIGGGGGGTGTNDDDEMTKLKASALLFSDVTEKNEISFYEYDNTAKITELKTIKIENLDSRTINLLIESYKQKKWIVSPN